MKDIIRYTNGEVTVLWQPSLCSHSTKCWKQLRSVFDPTKRPWVNMQGATSAEIMNQVKECPSGALSFQRNASTAEEDNMTRETTVQIEVQPSGPLLVHGSIEIKDREGNITQKENHTAFCRCGHSANKPFCDGAHRKVGFEG